MRFLDDVIDANRYPLAEIERATRATRKIGLGIMGWADALVALDIAYDSDAALELAGRLAAFLEDESLAASRRARRAARAISRRGRARAGSTSGQRPLRNATTTTIAPTGTISIIAGCASGIEPLYALAYRRNVLDGAELVEIDPGVPARSPRERGVRLARAVRRGRRARRRARDRRRPADVQRRFPTAHEIDVDTHVRMQAAFQRHVHAAGQQDDQPPARRHRARRQSCVPARLRARVARESPSIGTAAARARCSSPVRARAVAERAPGCPECGNVLVMQARCRLCRHCGWSVCSSERSIARSHQQARSQQYDERDLRVLATSSSEIRPSCVRDRRPDAGRRNERNPASARRCWGFFRLCERIRI